VPRDKDVGATKLSKAGRKKQILLSRQLNELCTDSIEEARENLGEGGVDGNEGCLCIPWEKLHGHLDSLNNGKSFQEPAGGASVVFYWPVVYF